MLETLTELGRLNKITHLNIHVSGQKNESLVRLLTATKKEFFSFPTMDESGFNKLVVIIQQILI